MVGELCREESVPHGCRIMRGGKGHARAAWLDALYLTERLERVDYPETWTGRTASPFGGEGDRG